MHHAAGDFLFGLNLIFEVLAVNILSLVSVRAVTWLSLVLVQDRKIIVIFIYLSSIVLEWYSRFIDSQRSFEFIRNRFEIGCLICFLLVLSLINFEAILILLILVW